MKTSFQRIWSKLLIAMVALAALVGAFAYVHHIRGARYIATAIPIEQTSFDECMAALTGKPYLYSDTASRSICEGNDAQAWFLIAVKNVGHRAAFVTACTVEGLDAAGDSVFAGDVRTPRVGCIPCIGLYLDPGQTVEYRWHLDVFAANNQGVDRYVASCEPIDYGGKDPV